MTDSLRQDWVETTLGAVAETNLNSIGKSYPYQNIEYLDTGSITCGVVEEYQNYDLTDAPSRAKRLVRHHDIIYSTVRPIQRHYGFIENPLDNIVVSTGFTVVTCNNKKVYPKFIYYFLTSDDIVEELDIIAEASTSAYPSLRPKDIENLSFSLPPLPEQQAIAEILSSLDDKIDLLNRQNKTLEALAETLFRQWFIEEADEAWEEGCLGDAIVLFDNKRIPLSKMQRDKMKDGMLYPYYGAASIMDKVNNYLFDGEYILLGEDGTVKTDEDYPVLQYATGKFWVNNHAHILQAKKPYNNFFIWCYLSKKNIDEIITGAVQPKISQTNLKALDFPKFPEILVNNFISNTDEMFTKVNNNKKQIQTLKSLRDTLLPKLMSGDVRVRMEAIKQVQEVA